MDVFYEHFADIDSRDADGQGHCRPSALLGHLQQAATLAAEDGGFGRERFLQRYDAFWMLARIWYRLDRPLRMGERLTIRTWHRGGKAASMYRDFDLYAGGAPIGEAVSVWVLADWNSHRLLRLGAIPELDDTSGGSLCKDHVLARLRPPAGLAETERRPLRYSDTDINGHVNNTRYADFACDAIHAELLPQGSFVSSLQIGYIAECLPGEVLTILTEQTDTGAFVRGTDEAGAPRFDAMLTIGQSGAV